MKIRTVTLASSAALAAALLAGCTSTTTMPGMGNGMTNAPTATTSSTTDDSHNMADLMFVQMMIPHHEQAIEMSDMILDKSDVDPEITALAQKIKDAQQPEIAEMKSWLKVWGVGDQGGMMDDMGSGSGTGMMSDDDMAALEAADGADAGRLFLDQMIQHHTGAIDMAQSEVDDGQNPEVVKLAQNIITSQTTEIEAMKGLLNTN